MANEDLNSTPGMGATGPAFDKSRPAFDPSKPALKSAESPAENKPAFSSEPALNSAKPAEPPKQAFSPEESSLKNQPAGGRKREAGSNSIIDSVRNKIQGAREVSKALNDPGEYAKRQGKKIAKNQLANRFGGDAANAITDPVGFAKNKLKKTLRDKLIKEGAKQVAKQAVRAVAVATSEIWGTILVIILAVIGIILIIIAAVVIFNAVQGNRNTNGKSPVQTSDVSQSSDRALLAKLQKAITGTVDPKIILPLLDDIEKEIKTTQVNNKTGDNSAKIQSLSNQGLQIIADVRGMLAPSPKSQTTYFSVPKATAESIQIAVTNPSTNGTIQTKLTSLVGVLNQLYELINSDTSLPAGTFVLDTPWYHGESGLCNRYAVYMAASYYAKKYKGINTLAKQFDQRKGYCYLTQALYSKHMLAAGFSQNQFSMVREGYSSSINWGKVIGILKDGNPIVIHTEIYGNRGHWVTITGFSQDGKTIYYNDDAASTQKTGKNRHMSINDKRWVNSADPSYIYIKNFKP